MFFDVIIRNGKILDGSGNPWYAADIAIRDGKIAKIGALQDEKAAQYIDASGRVVSPGFMDIHTHSDARVFASEQETGKIRQGVTTEVIGNCGISAAPVADENLDLQKRYAGPFFGRYPISWKWRSLADYLREIEQHQIIGNIAPLVGHGTVRVAVMGFDDRRPTSDELEKMRQLVAEAMEAGAFGLSSGLIYPPGLYSNAAEMVELCRVVAAGAGIYTTHMRNESDKVVDSVKEAIEVAKQAGLPLQISHHKVAGKENWGLSEKTLALMEEARGRGLDVTFDVYPYTAGNTFLSALLPPWANEGGVERMLERLKNQELRAKIKQHIREGLPGWDNFIALSGGYHNICLSSCRNTALEGRTISEIAEETSQSPDDAVLGILADNQGEVTMVVFLMDENEVSRLIAHPLGMVASDAIPVGGKPHPRYYGTFPRVLAKYVRKEKVLSLADAIRKMTSMPAQKLGLWDRGMINVGMWADLVVFDSDKVNDTATYQDPVNYPAGIGEVLVNGRLVVENGQYTGATPGKVLRRNREVLN